LILPDNAEKLSGNVLAQNTIVEAAPTTKRYTRADFAALRYRLNGLSLEVASRVYGEDDLAARGIDSMAGLNAWLKDLLAVLVERARKANPHIAANLENAQRFNRWPTQVLNFLIAAGEQDYSVPRPDDTLTEWLKPRVVGVLKAEGIESPGALKRYIEARGIEWHKGIPRIGAGKARTLEKWLHSNAQSMGPLTMPSPPPARTGQVELAPHSPLMPLDHVGHIRDELSGVLGKNRNHEFCLLSARNDLDAVHAYLMRFTDRAATQRAYKKELERFLLWCVKERRIAMSSALTEDCEAYKAFIANPPDAWKGARVSRTSSSWRPFAGALEPQSQRYAVQAIRTFFAWLVSCRYLGGNPWVTVNDPAVEGKLRPIDIDKALPAKLWLRLVAVGGLLDRVAQVAPGRAEQNGAIGHVRHGRSADTAAGQYRLARAAVLLIGMSGIRREEATRLTRKSLTLVDDLPEGSPPLWELLVQGKGRKRRMVVINERTVDAIRAHWADRGHDFDAICDLALISPISAATPAARVIHVADDGFSLRGNAFTPDGLYQVVRTTVRKMANDPKLGLDAVDAALLHKLAPHALRHTFATLAVQKMPIDVLRDLLGHASLDTTSIYVKAERKRALSAYAAYIAE
jgi:site-specific recombinase XerD